MRNEYLITLNKIEVVGELTEETNFKDIENLIENCIEIKEIEKETQHDVKSIEYYLKIEKNES